MAESGEDETLHVNEHQQQLKGGHPNIEAAIEEPDIESIDKVYR